MCKSLYVKKLTLKIYNKIKNYIVWAFIKPYIKMSINQHFHFLFEPVASHYSAYCYELFLTI